MAKTPRTNAELKELLAQQIQFLEASAAAFDGGFTGEAVRMAVSIRVLCHDTAMSVSLLSQLAMKDQKFVSTAIEHNPKNILTHSGLVAQYMTANGTEYIAPLDDVVGVRYLDFKDWWDEIVFLDVRGRSLSRKRLIQIAANEDGGAHVDPALNEIYRDIKRNNALGWVFRTPKGQSPLGDPSAPSIRQITHEILKILKPEYTAKRELAGDGLLTMGLSMVAVEEAPPGAPQ